MPFAITLKAARVNAGISQKEAGLAIGVSSDTISHWENGKSCPQYISFLSMCDLYRLNPENIILPKKLD